MKIRQLFCTAAFAVFVVCAGVGCKTTNPGVEVGNPKITGQQVRVTPATGDIDYLVTILDESRATISKIQRTALASVSKGLVKGSYVILETITVTYTKVDDDTYRFQGAFADGKDVNISIDFNSAGTAGAVALAVEGAPVAVTEFTATQTADDSVSGSASLAPSDFTRGVTANVVLPREE